jgi:glucose-6-phosphate isomerase
VAQAPGLSASLGAHQQAYETALRQLDDSGFKRRLLAQDPSLWNGDQAAIANRLGWLTVAQTMRQRLPELTAFAADVRQAGFERVVLLGMGGSSLAPEVMSTTFGAAAGYPSLLLLDTTDPATIAAAERTLDLERTLFVVSSKSGTTTETASLHRYFADKCPKPLANFIAITDPGTPLADQAEAEGFRDVFLNPPDVGGRFSALSCFGLVPAAAIGVVVSRLLDSAGAVDVRSAVELGALLGGLALAGREKITFVATPSLRGFGAWAEQLLAESTGKLGKGIVPVDGEPLGAPGVYGDDRVFVYLRLTGESGPEAELRALEAVHPVITITLADRYDLGGEFLRWEIATAAAGAVLGINPFDEPNVAEAKERTGEILRQGLPSDGRPNTSQGDAVLSGLLEAARPGDYFAILAYIQRTPDHDQLLTRLRVTIRDRTRLATSLGYGPRYLHSTGQLFKGGPDTGIFLQIVADDTVDLAIPGATYTFGALKRAQAQGDLQALESRGRRAVRLDLGAGATAALERIVSDLEAQKRSAAPAAGG